MEIATHRVQVAGRTPPPTAAFRQHWARQLRVNNLTMPCRRRLVRVSHRVVFGTLDAVNHVLTPCGWQINMAFVERLNLDMRRRVAAVG